jgi:hypothetical protein
LDGVGNLQNPNIAAGVEQVKLFCFVSDLDLESVAGVVPTKTVVDASTMVGLLPTTQAWLAYCFEITMLRLTTGGAKGSEQFSRQQAASRRGAAQASRINTVQQMHLAMTARCSVLVHSLCKSMLLVLMPTWLDASMRRIHYSAIPVPTLLQLSPFVASQLQRHGGRRASSALPGILEGQIESSNG